MPEFLSFSEIESFVQGYDRSDPATESAIIELEAALGVRLPATYCALMRYSNGLEGFTESGDYILLWQIEQVASLNAAYRVSEFAPGLILFGSDGGGSGYAFETGREHWQIVDVPLVGMSRSEVRLQGRCFDDFIRKLRKGRIGKGDSRV